MACLLLHNEKWHCSFQIDAAITLFWYKWDWIIKGTNWWFGVIVPHLSLTHRLVGVDCIDKTKMLGNYAWFRFLHIVLLEAIFQCCTWTYQSGAEESGLWRNIITHTSGLEFHLETEHLWCLQMLAFTRYLAARPLQIPLTMNGSQNLSTFSCSSKWNVVCPKI